jgi:phenylalanine-4-hydroxylase
MGLAYVLCMHFIVFGHFVKTLSLRFIFTSFTAYNGADIMKRCYWMTTIEFGSSLNLFLFLNCS